MKPSLFISTAGISLLSVAMLAWLTEPGNGPLPHARDALPSPGLHHGIEANAKQPNEVAAPHFVDATLESGLLHVHLQGDEKLTGLNETLGAGACAFDFDNDGWVDIFAVGGSGQTRFYGRHYWWQKPSHHRLYRNHREGTFVDVTEAAGLGVSGWGMGCAAADLDNDGDVDVFVTQFGQNVLYRNNGDGTFEDVSAEAGLTQDAWSTSAVIADFDLDGLLDIYVVNYLRYVKGAKTFEAHSGFDLGMSPAFDATLYDGVANQLLKNEGNLRFRDIATDAGVDDASGRGLSANVLDVNADRFPDLYVGNDAGSPNQLYINNKDGTFENVTTPWKAGVSAPTLGLASGDVDHDGDIDLFLGSAAGELPKLLVRGTTPFWPRDEPAAVDQFRDLGRELGVADERYVSHAVWANAIADFNNDGRLDLLSVSGRVTPDPTTYKLSQGQSKLLWLGTPDGRFVAAEGSSVPMSDRLSGRGTVVADFDNDGDLDLYVNNNNDLNQYLRNDSAAGNWIGFRVLSEHNRHASGATIQIQTDAGGPLMHVGAQASFLSQSEGRVHFGLGEQTGEVAVRVRWPNGQSATYPALSPNRYYEIRPGQPPAPLDSVRPSQRGPTLRLALGSDEPESRRAYVSLFRDANHQLDDNEFTAALADNSADVRLAVIDMLSLPGDPRTFRRLIAGLENDNAEVRLAALEKLRQLENEYSTRWLLRRFDDPDPRVRRALAQAYGFFFREEEAMVHRKYLAIPYLIRLLDDADQDVRLSAILALGESENFRGVQPLARLLKDDTLTVRAESARALGRIRERDAAPALVAVVESDNQPPEVKAQALIALKRLSEPRLSELMRHLWRSSADGVEPMAVSLAIRRDATDGIVFNPTTLALDAIGAIDATAQRVLSKDALLALCALLANLQDARVTQQLVALSDHEDSDVRAAAKRAMQINSPSGESAMSPPAEVRALRATLRGALRPGTFLPTAPLAVKEASQHQTDDAVLEVLQAVSERRETWATDIILDVAIDVTRRVDVRTAAFRYLATRATVRVNNAMFVLLDRKAEPARLAVIESASIEDARIQDRLTQMLRDKSESAIVRLAAAKRLMSIAPQETLAVVRGDA